MGLSGKCRDLRAFLSFWYLQWEVYWAMYMMEPAEKLFVNFLLVSIFSAIVYGCVTFLPGHMIMMMRFLHITAGDAGSNATGSS